MLILNPTVSGSFKLSTETELTATSASFATTSSYSNSIAENSVGYSNISSEFKASIVLTAGGSVDVDCSTGQTFTLTPDQNFALNITNPRIGQTKFLVITGAGGGYGLSWTVNGSAGTFNRIAGAYNDTTATKNFIQLSCVSATEFWYSISQIDL